MSQLLAGHRKINMFTFIIFAFAIISLTFLKILFSSVLINSDIIRLLFILIFGLPFLYFVLAYGVLPLFGKYMDAILYLMRSLSLSNNLLNYIQIF